MNNFEAALRGTDHETIPVWFMRQAGRYLQGYRNVRKHHSIKDICRDASLTLQVTEEPVKEIGVDAAIIFSDIMLPVEAMGFRLDFREGTGPVVENSLKSNPELSGIIRYDPHNYRYATLEAISKFRENNTGVPIIGFSGGPVTIASYLAQGRPDRDLAFTKSLLLKEHPGFLSILEMVKEMVIENSRQQIKRGAAAIQIFDSWSGYLSPYQFRKYSRDYLQEIASELSSSSRTIYFSTQTGGMIPELRETGFNFLSLDWRMRLHDVSKHLDHDIGLQGNLDPSLVSGSPSEALTETRAIISEMRQFPPYIFNLGHGVLPDTNPQTLKDIVKLVHGEERSV